MYCCQRGQKCGSLCPVPSPSCAWISLLPVGNLFGRLGWVPSNSIVGGFWYVFVFNILTHRWRETSDGHWTGVMGGRVWTLTQTEDALWYHVYKNQESPGEENVRKWRAGASVQMENKSERLMGALQKREEEGKEAVILKQDTEEEKEMLRNYFQLNVKLEDLYKEWGDTDPHFRRIASIFTGQFVCVCTDKISLITQSLITEPIFALKVFFWSHPRCADATPGPHRMPFFIHLHLQQPHLSHPGHGWKVVPGSWHPTVPAGSNILLQLSFPVCPRRWAIPVK